MTMVLISTKTMLEQKQNNEFKIQTMIALTSSF